MPVTINHLAGARTVKNKLTSVSKSGIINRKGVISYGPELLVNNNFAAWSGDNPTGWTVTAEDATHYVSQTANGARYVSGTTVPVLNLYQNVFSANKVYKIDIFVYSTTPTSGGTKWTNQSSVVFPLTQGLNSFTEVRTASGNFLIQRQTINADVIISWASVKEILI